MRLSPVVPAPPSSQPPNLPGAISDDEYERPRANPAGNNARTSDTPRVSRVSFMPESDMAIEEPPSLRLSDLTGVRPSKRSHARSIYDQAPPDPVAPKPLIEQDPLSRSKTISAHSPCRDAMRSFSTRLVDSHRFTAFTMTLTVYALFGDDLRLATTHKRMDVFFDVLTIFCIIVFTFEVVVTCIARRDYFGSFFFWLDVCPSGTLVLDLTFVADALFCNGVGGGSALKSGRAGRAGARAGRTVRIIRLIRLVKVYKMYAQALQDREVKRREEEKARQREEDLESDASGDEAYDESPSSHLTDEADLMDADGKKQSDEQQKETRVGKKLSEMTTRRVIVLVLVMLFGLPQFMPDSHNYGELKTSANLGMEMIYDKWRRWCHKNATHPTELPSCLRPDAIPLKQATADQSVARHWYEKTFLSFVYLHHDGPFAWTLHWVGFSSKSLTDKFEANGVGDASSDTGAHIGVIAQLAQKKLLGSNFIPVSEWNSRFADPGWVQEVVDLSPEVQSRLATPWDETCLSTFHGVRVAIKTSDNEDGAKCSLDEDLRCAESEYYVPIGRSVSESDDLQMVFAFDKRTTTTLEAGLSMLQTIFICLAVGIGAMTFSNDANLLLLKPIERMMTKLETIKDNPMGAMRLGDLEFRRHQFEHLMKRDELKKSGWCRRCLLRLKHKQKVNEPMETVILERTIIKLGGLLALCFGETGGDILAHYISSSSTANTSTVDINVPGRKMNAIIGLCQMHSLDRVLSCLEHDALLFINMVSEVVHEIVDSYSGAPNKNMGCSFLLAWRLSDSNASSLPDGERLTQSTGKFKVKSHNVKLTDCAIMACVRTISKVHSCPELAKYSADRGDGSAIPDFNLSIGFGLHLGWAIEGIVGSDFKIDASYVSPQVNMASALQKSTPKYGVKVMLSHQLVQQASEDMAAACRVIDHVLVREKCAPVRLYTVDLDPAKVAKKFNLREKGNRFRLRQIREVNKAEKWAEAYCIADEFRTCRDVIDMRAKYSPEFFKRFFTAYRNYESGEWLVARDMFFTCDYVPDYKTPPVDITEEQWPEDGPTRALLRFMQSFNFEAPEDWPGYRLIPGGKQDQKY